MLIDVVEVPLPFYQTTFSDPLFTLLYYFWLDLSYQNLFYTFLFLFLFQMLPTINFTKLIFYFYLTVILYSSGLNDFFVLNSLMFFSDYTAFPGNTLLTNSLNKYHPFIFYVSLIFLFHFFLSTLVTFTSNKIYNELWQLCFYFKIRSKIFFFNFLSLFLGSWWALQEWTWGGWWNWDPSETFGLGPLALILILGHSFISINVFRNYCYKIFIFTFIFFLSLFMVQLNFEILSHNFGLKFFYFFNENGAKFTYILTTLFLIRLQIYFKLHNYFFLSFTTNFLFLTLLKSKEKVFYIVYIVFFTVYLVFLVSFSQLFNHTFWKLFNLNFNFWNWVHPIFILACLYFLVLISWFITQHRLYFLSLNLFFLPNFTSLGFLFFSKNKFQNFHLLMGWLWIINQISLEKDFFNWSLIHSSTQNIANSNLTRPTPFNHSFSGGVVSKNFFWQDLYITTTRSYQIFFTSYESYVKQSFLGGQHATTDNIQIYMQNRFHFSLKTTLHNLEPLTLFLFFTTTLFFTNFSLKLLKTKKQYLP